MARRNPRHSADIKGGEGEGGAAGIYHCTPIKPNGRMIITRTARTITTTVQLPNDIKAKGRKEREEGEGEREEWTEV